MSKIRYNKETLVKFSLEELQKICRYYEIEYLPSWSKSKLAKEILAYSTPELIRKTYDFEKITPEPINYGTSSFEYEPYISPKPVIIQKSVRVLRIEQSKRKE